MSGESQSIRKIHVAAPLLAMGWWHAACICGWADDTEYSAESVAMVESKRHARTETLAQLRGERGGAG